jgi:tyrosine-protein kinase Etk/Wzc
VMKRNRFQVVQTLQQDLTIVEKGRKTGVIRIALVGPDPREVRDVLNEIAQTYVRQNVERKSAEAEKTLEFIGAQLPILRANAERSEYALSSYRSTKGAAVDLNLEAKAMLDRAAEVEKRAAELALQRAELRQRFTDNHPLVVALRSKEATIEQERGAINAQIKVLPEAELNSVRLMRDVKVANELYLLLLNKAQELKVAKSGTIGNVRILDRALVPYKPTRPRTDTVLGVSVLVGLGLGFAASLVRRSLTGGVDDPADIEREFQISVYATIPHSTAQTALTRGRARGAGLLAASAPADVAVESLRSLRTSIQFALTELSSNIVVVAGPTPGVGKSFVTANLAAVFADVGKRVVLVDGDLRKGRLHRDLAVEKEPGLSDVIRGTASLEDVVRPTPVPNLWVIPLGSAAPNPAELLSSDRFDHLVERLSSDFDLVVADTPPILAVTDGALIGRRGGVNVLVLRSGRHPLSEIASTVKRLGQNGVAVRAVVLNDVERKLPGYGNRYRYYHAYE